MINDFMKQKTCL